MRNSNAVNEAPGRCIILVDGVSDGPRHNIAHIVSGCYDNFLQLWRTDVFLTFTCNLVQDEITTNLATNQTPSDRHDLISRVYNLKVEALCHHLFKKVHSEVCAYIYVIEFQNRGLPHMHMLITLNDG